MYDPDLIGISPSDELLAYADYDVTDAIDAAAADLVRAEITGLPVRPGTRR